MSAASEIATAVDLLSLEPFVRDAPTGSLGLERMPTEAHVRRDHFPVPRLEPASWRLEVAGLVERALALRLDELERYPQRELAVVLECAGHRRADYQPATRGLPWQTGAVSEAVWAGTSLAHVLEQAGLRGGRFVVLEGADHGPFRGSGEFAFARALPIAKALDPDTLLAWEMNGEPLPSGHGAPLRAIVPGWYATDSVKWLRRITVLDQPFQGPFEAIDYRLASEPEQQGRRLTTLPVQALLTSLGDGERRPAGAQTLHGIAWGGTSGVARVDISIDGGDWEPSELKRPSGRYASSHWSFTWLAQPGLRTVAVRATDTARHQQPPQPPWNEGGYANSSIQRVRILVENP